MSLYLKVPPNKGPCVSIFLFEDTRLLKKKNILEYKDIILYTDLKFQSWTQLPVIKKKLNTLRSSIVNENINIVVCDKGYHKNETLFVSYLTDDEDIPLIDQMICTFYKISPRRLTYTQQKKPHFVCDRAMMSLLEGEILTKQERRLLGIEHVNNRNKAIKK